MNVSTWDCIDTQIIDLGIRAGDLEGIIAAEAPVVGQLCDPSKAH